MIACPERVNIAAYLPKMAREQPYRQAVVFPEGRDRSGNIAYTHFTFAQLDQESELLAAGLLAKGLKPGMRTVLMVKPSLAFFGLTFALFKLGAVPVFIDPGMGLKNLKTCLGEAEPEAFIGIAKAHIARVLLGWPKVKLRVCVEPTVPGFGIPLSAVREAGKTQEFTLEIPKRETTAAILFTSGSTGIPKGVVYSHGIFDAQTQMLRELYDIRPGEIDLCTFPLFALFGPALGMTAVIPDMDFTQPAQVDPQKLVTAIKDFGCTNMFGSPALLNRVGRWAEGKKLKLPSIRRVISAGAPVQAPILRRFCQLLAEQTQVFTPYGATESLPVASIGSKEILAETAEETDRGKGICVGRPAPGVQLQIIKIDDKEKPRFDPGMHLPDGEVGEIIVTSPSVTQQYYNREQATRLAKMKAADGVVYHRMGDLGYMDGTGRLWFCGRKAHRVTGDQGDMYTVPCEGVFNVHPDVFRTALVGLGEPGHQCPVLCVELEKRSQKNQETVRTELLEIAAAHEHTKPIKTILFHPEFPVDIRHNAKIFREKLAVWAAQQT